MIEEKTPLEKLLDSADLSSAKVRKAMLDYAEADRRAALARAAAAARLIAALKQEADKPRGIAAASPV